MERPLTTPASTKLTNAPVRDPNPLESCEIEASDVRALVSKPVTPLLDQVKIPEDLRKLKPEQLPQLADELRLETIDAVSVTGGHLGAGLGVVELTTALHYVFDTPQ